MRKNTRTVAEAWEDDRTSSGQRSIWTDGVHIYSYGTCIAARVPKTRTLILNGTKYSPTTSQHQAGLRLSLGDYIAGETDGLDIGCTSRDVLLTWAQRHELHDLADLANERRPPHGASDRAWCEFEYWLDDALYGRNSDERNEFYLIRRILAR